MRYGAIYPSLKGRTVLVTGGGSGIGEAIVEHFAAQGSKVGFIDIAREAVEGFRFELRRAQAADGSFRALPTSPTLPRCAQGRSPRSAGVLGPITILVNNAAHDERHTTRGSHAGIFRRSYRSEPQAPVLHHPGRRCPT